MKKRVFKNKKITKHLTDHYQIWMVNKATRRKVFKLKLNGINFLLIVSFFFSFIILLTFLVLKYSPIKEYFIPEDSTSSSQYKKQLLELTDRVAHLEDSLAFNQLYLQNVQAVITGNIKAQEIDSAMKSQAYISASSPELKASKEDSIFRAQIAQEELEELARRKKESAISLYFVPVQGAITSRYDLTENHLAVDIAAKEGESIKSISQGDILFSDWLPDTGYTLIVSHPNDVVSMYKHCSKVFKKVGDEVKKGEAIAEVGNTGELSTGPHLHFELWVKGKAVDPEEYINF